MVAVSHQMVALLAALGVLTIYPHSVGFTVGVLAVIAVMVGALTPDLDHPTAAMGQKLLGARIVHNLFGVFSGGHRHFTHSLLGIAGIGWLTYWVGQNLLNPEYHQQAFHVWQAFMVGYISHPIADSLTDQGVPWFWPLRWHLRFPPGPKAVRITTGSLVEILIVRAVVFIIILFILRYNWLAFTRFFQ